MRPHESMKVLGVVRSEAAKESLTSALTEVNDTKFDVLVGKVEEIGSEVIDVHAPDVLVLDIDLSSSPEFEALEGLIHTYGAKVGVIATSGDATLEGVRSLMRLGVADFLPQPIAQADLLGALEYAARKAHRAESGHRSRAKIFSFIKPVGGVGATMLAVQSTYCLRSLGGKDSEVCLMDLDLQFGNAAVYQDLQSKFSVLDILQSSGELDGAYLRDVMAHHSSGIDLLAAPLTLESLEVLNPDFVANLLEVAGQEYDYVVIDMPQALTDWTQVVLDRSDMIFLVTELSVAAIRQSRRLLDILRERGLVDTRIAILVNRYESRWGKKVSVKEAEKALGRRIDYFVPNEYKIVNTALNEGVRLSKIKSRSKVEKQIGAVFASVLKDLRRKGEKSPELATAAQ